MKAILIIDIPQHLLNSDKYYAEVYIKPQEFGKNWYEERVEAELKPMPKEREDESCHEYDCCLMTSIGGIGDARCYRCGEANGWNECIEEILGE